MRYDDGSTILHEIREGFLNQGFGFGIECAGGFVENENRSVFQNSASNSDTLALAAG